MRYQVRKVIAVSLLALNVSGARVVAVSDACEHNRTFFGPTLSFKALARTVTHQQWRQPAPHSLGERGVRYSSRDIEVVQRQSQILPIAILPPINITLGTERSKNRLAYAWKSPGELSPVQPPQLHSRK